MAGQAKEVQAGHTDGLLVPGAVSAGDARLVPATPEAVPSETVSVLEETLSVSKRTVKTGRVRVSTRTETHEEIADLAVERSVVDVTRVPVNRIVEQAPQVRTEGDTTIVPVLEERLVVVKQMVLVEELHIRHRVEREDTRIPVSLRRQQVDVEHLDADGHPIT